MVVRDHPALSLSRQCRLLSVGRSSLYYTPKGESAETLVYPYLLLIERANHVGDITYTAYAHGSREFATRC